MQCILNFAELVILSYRKSISLALLECVRVVLLRCWIIEEQAVEGFGVFGGGGAGGSF